VGNKFDREIGPSVINLVWLKRDLRLSDHKPLWQAVGQDVPFALVYVFENDYWQLPDTSARQWQFIHDSLLELKQQAQRLGGDVWLLHGNAIACFEQLHRRFSIKSIFSHEETGNDWTFQRDKQFGKWCQTHNISWQQYPQFAVTRGKLNRDSWDKLWQQFMSQPTLPVPDLHQALLQEPLSGCNETSALTLASSTANPLNERLDKFTYVGNDSLTCAQPQRAGSLAAKRVLNSFIDERHKAYLMSVSSPIKGQQNSSRLSCYLAYGNISLREVVHTTIAALPHTSQKRALTAFKSRLHWHCHFIQKMETEPQLEKHALHQSLRLLRSESFQQDAFDAWKKGLTGVPFVDACMRMLQHYGWINFRMRAMLISFSSYQLWLPWQQPAQHLAQQFTDYEPGIHYPQIQMQSGTTGINPFRIYNPVKQGERFDPKGEFIRRWVPELDKISSAYIHQPWLASEAQRGHYPKPAMEPLQGARLARNTLFEYYKNHVEKEETARVIQVHASRAFRKRMPAKRKTTLNHKQMSLF
jgi:deoxyribodipyrimidine photo-lyase